MASFFRITVDDKDLRRVESNVIKFIHIEIPQLTKAEALRGAKFARSIAPRQTGKLWQAIDMAPGRKGKGETSYVVVSRTPKNQNRRVPRPYHYYINLGRRGNYFGHRKSGVHDYMRVTYEYLKGNYKNKIMSRLDKALK